MSVSDRPAERDAGPQTRRRNPTASPGRRRPGRQPATRLSTVYDPNPTADADPPPAGAITAYPGAVATTSFPAVPLNTATPFGPP